MDSSGKCFLDSLSINNTFKEWFENLYKSELVGDTTQPTELFFSTLNLPTLSEDQTSFLNAPITKKEVLEAIKSLQSGKAPGPDELSSEFYKEFRNLLVDPLLNMLNDSFVKGNLPQSLREANISLILKKGKQAEDCSSYQLISLLNVDLKILSKILATRLECLLPALVKDDQTGFIVGRNSVNNMRRLLNVIQFAKQQSIDGLVISLDAEKAFDWIEWPYLFHTLQKFGLGEHFIKWVKLLYNEPLSAVLTNGCRSSTFRVGRGTRQGCPLSPLLFALIIEPLAEAIRTNNEMCGLVNNQHKIALYANDILISMVNPDTSTPALLDTIHKFSTFSGYRINYHK